MKCFDFFLIQPIRTFNWPQMVNCSKYKLCIRKVDLNIHKCIKYAIFADHNNLTYIVVMSLVRFKSEPFTDNMLMLALNTNQPINQSDNM